MQIDRLQWTECNIPDLAEGVIYTHVAAGDRHTVLLKSDGTAMAVGRNDFGQCNIPDLSEGDAYGGKKQVLTTGATVEQLALVTEVGEAADQVALVRGKGGERCRLARAHALAEAAQVGEQQRELRALSGLPGHEGFT